MEDEIRPPQPPPRAIRVHPDSIIYNVRCQPHQEASFRSGSMTTQQTGRRVCCAFARAAARALPGSVAQAASATPPSAHAARATHAPEPEATPPCRASSAALRARARAPLPNRSAPAVRAGAHVEACAGITAATSRAHHGPSRHAGWALPPRAALRRPSSTFPSEIGCRYTVLAAPPASASVTIT